MKQPTRHGRVHCQTLCGAGGVANCQMILGVFGCSVPLWPGSIRLVGDLLSMEKCEANIVCCLLLRTTIMQWSYRLEKFHGSGKYLAQQCVMPTLDLNSFQCSWASLWPHLGLTASGATFKSYLGPHSEKLSSDFFEQSSSIPCLVSGRLGPPSHCWYLSGLPFLPHFQDPRAR